MIKITDHKGVCQCDLLHSFHKYFPGSTATTIPVLKFSSFFPQNKHQPHAAAQPTPTIPSTSSTQPPNPPTDSTPRPSCSRCAAASFMTNAPNGQSKDKFPTLLLKRTLCETRRRGRERVHGVDNHHLLFLSLSLFSFPRHSIPYLLPFLAQTRKKSKKGGKKGERKKNEKKNHRLQNSPIVFHPHPQRIVQHGHTVRR